MPNDNPYARMADRPLVEAVVGGDGGAAAELLCRRMAPTLAYIVRSLFDGRARPEELASELFLYLADDGWAKLRSFDFRASLRTWLAVVAVRFFQKKRAALIENPSGEHLLEQSASLRDNAAADSAGATETSMDLASALSRMTNPRYRRAIELLDLQDREPEAVAREMEISVANLYNLHRRALLQLRLLLGRKEDYYG